MKVISELISDFKKILIERGHPENIIWLQWPQIWPTVKALYINAEHGFPYQSHVEDAYNMHKDDLDCGATLMLVVVDSNISYCTLLFDTFGSTDDVEVVEDKFYFWCDPYHIKAEIVVSDKKWWYLKKFKKRPLSSLDYMFSIKQAF